MPKTKLTHPFINNLSTPDKRTEYYDTVVDGLILRITAAGTKTFALTYGVKGKRYTIGRFPSIGLADARDIAKKLKIKVALGVDVQAEKIAKRNKPKDLTFKELTTEFEKKHMGTLREKTKTEYNRIIQNELLPTLGKKPAKEISRNEVIKLLDKKGITDGKKTMANRLRSRLHSIFEFGLKRGLVESNPVSTCPKYAGGERKKERFYSQDEIKSLWDAFESQEEPARSVFKMLLLCGQRSKETRHMKWEDIQNNIWTIPEDLSKSHRKHEVPLSNSAMEILRDRKKSYPASQYVFESTVSPGRPLEGLKRPKDKVRDMSKVNDFTPHDLRRTAATYMAKLGIDRTVLGKILNHKGLAGDGLVTAIYDRHSYLVEKNAALSRWADHLEQILNEELKPKVHKIG